MVKPKVIKKQWYPILAPKIFQSEVIGETHVYEPSQMVGKGITKNLMNLTNDVKRQNININFKIVDVENGKGLTNIVGYYMVQSSIRRLIRRNIEKISMSFPCRTSDNKNILFKPLLITRFSTTGSVATKIRKNAQDSLVKYISAISYDNLVNDLISHKLQNSLKKELSKIYPLRICEIRSMEIVDLEKKNQVQKTVDKKEKLARKAQEVNNAEKREEKAKENKDIKKEEVKESKEEKKPAEVKATAEKEQKQEQTA